MRTQWKSLAPLVFKIFKNWSAVRRGAHLTRWYSHVHNWRKKASKKHPIPQLCKRTTLLYYLRISTTIHPKSQTIINISNIKYTIANAIYTLEMQKSRKVSLRLGCMNPKEPKPSFWSNMIYMPQCQVIMISTSSPKLVHYWFNADTPSVSFDISCDF